MRLTAANTRSAASMGGLPECSMHTSPFHIIPTLIEAEHALRFDKNLPEEELLAGLKLWIKTNFPPAIVRYCLDASAPENTVLLTFDDGPAPGPTMEILDILEKHRIKALFFVVGARARLAPSVLSEITDRGHAIGNHSFNHEEGGVRLYDYWAGEIESCQSVVRRETGREPEYFRPPFGKLPLPLFAAAFARRLHIMKWSFDVGDLSFLEKAPASYMADRLVQGLQSRDIVLMHDKCLKTPRVLEKALPRLIDKGFRFDGLKYI